MALAEFLISELDAVRVDHWFEPTPRCRALLLVVVLALASGPLPSRAQDDHTVDLELVLLVDVSASVSNEEFHLQMNGLAAAFQSAPVLDAIGQSAQKGIVVSVIQWADEANQRVSEDWTLIRGKDDARWLAARIASMPRLIHGGHTALGNALAFAMQELESNRFAGLRRVIDLSGDGRNNDGRPLRRVRREVIEAGITINGLAILNELPLLDDYFRDHLIGGEGAFLIVAQDYDDFTQAMIEKLDREIRSIPLVKNLFLDPSGRDPAKTTSVAAQTVDDCRARFSAKGKHGFGPSGDLAKVTPPMPIGADAAFFCSAHLRRVR